MSHLPIPSFPKTAAYQLLTGPSGRGNLKLHIPASTIEMTLKSAIYACVLALLCAACKTTSPDEPSEVKAVDDGPVTMLELEKDDEQNVYLKMLSVELGAGVVVPKDQLHSNGGLVECVKDGVLETCTLRVRISGDDLSSTQSLTQGLSEKIWKFVRQARPDLPGEKLMISDLVCDYIGKKSPPFNVEDVKCSVSLPRAIDEAVFANLQAEELAESLRGAASYGEKTTNLNGSISCQWITGSNRPTCVVRAIVGGVLSEKVTEISAANAGQVAKRLKRAAMDAARIGQDPKGQAGQEPRTVDAAITCAVDNSKWDGDGKRTYLCRSKI